ncbi:hypothetical protein [Candidatus Pelagibacter sp. HIMB1495]|uniref:hypothetical protein n=1 Tax=unclassified Candidatus Pelagibacter TaxID=2647897 RepID=UPI003F87DED3
MQKFLIVGCERSGTHKVKEFIYNNLKIKIKIQSFEKKIYEGLLRRDIFLKKKNFYIFNPALDKKYETIKKKILLKKKILSTHKFYNEIFYDFKGYNFILTTRDPIDLIVSTILYVTKKTTLNFNKQYKIKDAMELAKNKKTINNYIKNYNNFYKKFLTNKNLKNLNKFIIIDLKEKIKKKFLVFGYKNYKIKKSYLHSTKPNKKLHEFIKKNYNFDKSYEIYKLIKKNTK